MSNPGLKKRKVEKEPEEESALKKRKVEERKLLEQIASEVVEEVEREELCDTDPEPYNDNFNLGPGVRNKLEFELYLEQLLLDFEEERKPTMALAPLVIYASQIAEELVKREKIGSYEWLLICKLLQCFPVPSMADFINPVEKAILKKWIYTCCMLLKYVKDQITAEMKLRKSNFKKRKVEEQEMLAGIETFYETYRFSQQVEGLVDEETWDAMRMIAMDEGCLEIFLSKEKARDFLFRVFGNQIGYSDEVLKKAFRLDDQK